MKRAVTRGELLFVFGLLGLLIELGRHVFIGDTADPTLVLVFAAMLGLPKLIANGNNHAKRESS